MTTQDVAPVSTDLEELWREHDDRLTVMALDDDAASTRVEEITTELERIRTGSSLADAASLLAERREIQQRRQDRHMSRELTEAAKRELEVGIQRAKLESEVPGIEAELRARAADVRAALQEIVPRALALFEALEKHKALGRSVSLFRGKHGGGPSVASLERLTGLHPSEIAALRIILTNNAERKRMVGK